MVNYCPVSPLPLCGKIFERLIFNPVFEFLEKNKVLSPNQNWFWPNYSCENQLLSIIHGIYADYDQSSSLEVIANFLDISKAFDKVWHKGLLYKLETVGISSNLHKLFQSFLSDRFQRVVLNSQSSNWSPVLARVPQGAILGPLLFLVYITDLPVNLESLVKLFADDTSFFSTGYNPLLSAEIMNKDLIKISKWDNQWKMSFNPDTTKQAQEVFSHRNLRKQTIPQYILIMLQ